MATKKQMEAKKMAEEARRRAKRNADRKPGADRHRRTYIANKQHLPSGA